MNDAGEHAGRGTAVAHAWSLDPEVTFLNHGSYGACPTAVLRHQLDLREQLEREPVRFFSEVYPEALDEARIALARFVSADPEAIAFVDNATTGVNVAIRALDLEPGDELLVTDHEYNASRNALEHAAASRGASVRTIEIGMPVGSPDHVLERIVDAVGPRTRALLIDHVTSPTGLVLPVEGIVDALGRKGVLTIVDGARMHRPDRDGIENAKYHGAIGFGVMAGRPSGDESVVRFAGEHRVDRCSRASRSALGGLQGRRRHEGVGVKRRHSLAWR